MTQVETEYFCKTATVDSSVYLRCSVLNMKQDLTFFVVHLATLSTVGPDSIDREFKNMSLEQEVFGEKPVPVSFHTLCNPHLCQCRFNHYAIHICASAISSTRQSPPVTVTFYPLCNPHP